MNIYYVCGIPYSDELYHHGIRDQKWGIRRFQNADGTLTPAGKERYLKGGGMSEYKKHLIERRNMKLEAHKRNKSADFDEKRKEYVNKSKKKRDSIVAGAKKYEKILFAVSSPIVGITAARAITNMPAVSTGQAIVNGLIAGGVLHASVGFAARNALSAYYRFNENKKLGKTIL